jgi:hypothetical protein
MNIFRYFFECTTNNIPNKKCSKLRRLVGKAIENVGQSGGLFGSREIPHARNDSSPKAVKKNVYIFSSFLYHWIGCTMAMSTPRGGRSFLPIGDEGFFIFLKSKLN